MVGPLAQAGIASAAYGRLALPRPESDGEVTEWWNALEEGRREAAKPPSTIPRDAPGTHSAPSPTLPWTRNPYPRVGGEGGL